jgi:hypothetical protein
LHTEILIREGFDIDESQSIAEAALSVLDRLHVIGDAFTKFAEQSAGGLFFLILCFRVQRNLLRAQLFNQCCDALGNILIRRRALQPAAMLDFPI